MLSEPLHKTLLIASESISVIIVGIELSFLNSSSSILKILYNSIIIFCDSVFLKYASSISGLSISNMLFISNLLKKE